MLPIALGLGGAAAIGVGDFAAAIASRRLSPVVVGFWAQVTGLVLGVLMLLVVRPPLVPGQAPWSLLAGLASGIGIAFFYRALATGAIALVAPISACSVVFPVIFSVLRGETLTPLAAAGIVAIVSGIVLASLQPAPALADVSGQSAPRDRQAIIIAVVAAGAFGAFYILIAVTPQAAGWGTLWTAGPARLAALVVQGALVLLSRQGLTKPGRYGPAVITAGALDQVSLVLIGIGAMTNSYGIVAALVGLYPVVTALLGTIVLGERLTRVQGTGAVLAMTGVMLVSI